MATKKKEYKELGCRDFRSDCDFTVRSEKEEEVLMKCQEHACNAQGKCETSPEARAKIKSHIRGVWA